MASSFHFIVANLVLFFVIACSKKYVGPWGPYCNPNSNIPPDSPVSANIDNLLAAMVRASQMNNGFSGLSSGTDKNTIYGLAQCRGDVNIKEYCYPCIQDAVQQVINECPANPMLKSGTTIALSGIARTTSLACLMPHKMHWFGTKMITRTPNPIGATIWDIISKAVEHASGGIGTGKVDLPDSHTLYGAAQCTTDLRPFDCAQCLGAAVKEFDDFCKPKRGCRVYLSSCAVRYEIYNFLPPMMLGLRRFKVKLWKS
ncbi:hypothetical protein Cgig2_007261 [Carnegiea gigantea]|uniref:Gnk2-homologous domain-containing protein n=1 Tax=Carnegiea gigantea TaxID=171969 RepID=A0A9Q1KY92_9CARY|nr:hypothetical protein Cgig2_007261 [Carnegiea gigantea]